MMGRLLGLIALSMIVMAAHAQIYRCEVDGKPVFSQVPCAPDAKTMDVKVHKPEQETAEQAKARAAATVAQNKEARRQRKIFELEHEIERYQDQMDTEVARIDKKRNLAANNLAGATWEAGINEEIKGNRSPPYAEEAFGMGGRGGASVPFRAASITDLR